MSAEAFAHYADGIQSIASVVGALVAAGWAYSRFIRQQDNFPHIQTSAEIKPVCKQGDAWIIELVAVVENKGKVAHKFSNFVFDLNGLGKEDIARSDERWGGQVDFCRNVARGSFLPAPMDWFFIGPGVKSNYSWIASVPDTISVLNVHCTFVYVDRPSSSHTMEATIVLDQSGAA